MASVSDARKRAIELIEQLAPQQLTAIVQLLELLLSVPSQQTPSNSEEVALVETIQRHLPAEEQMHLDELRDRCEWAELTEREQQELVEYEDRLEQWRAERLEALITLAKLRNIDLLTLNRQFISESSSFHAS